MDSEAEARDYDSMDHAAVNRVFVDDFVAAHQRAARSHPAEIATSSFLTVLDVGTGTAQIPIELCRRHVSFCVVGTDLAEHMLRVGRDNVRRAGLVERIRLERIDAKHMSFAGGAFAAVMSNSIVHHIPTPAAVFAEMVRVTAPGGLLFVRDLLRPADESTLEGLVRLYAAGANDHQKKMFADSLHAALTLDEVRALVTPLGFDPQTVQQTSDRHWTWAACRA
jgi:ubiquinone/menaquinone biosynthesis C-methylase UbiE